ncbi:MAG: CBS domain-containing protein [Bacteroidota bacterium]
MLASDLIEVDVPVVNCQTSVGEVLEVMIEYKTSQLPVIDEQEVVGIVNDTDIDDKRSEEKIGLFKNEFQAYFINEKQLIYDVVKIMKEYDLVVVPVVDEKRKYIGAITPRAIVEYYGNTLAIEGGCTVFVLRMNASDYSLSEIAQITEGNDAKIFALQVFPEEQGQQISVVLSVKADDISGLLQTFHRYEYNVAASYDHNTFSEDIKDRFEELMKYINM